MKLKLYYGAIALLWLLTSCSPTNNITPRETIGIDDSHNRLYSFQINGHEYIYMPIMGLLIPENVLNVSMNLIA